MADTTFQISGQEGVLRLEGLLDARADPALVAATQAALDVGPAHLILDFHAVTYINSSGLASLVGVLSRARVADVPVRARGLTPHYLHVFEITRLSDLIEVEIEEATT